MAGVRGRSGGRNAKTAAAHRVNGTFTPSRHAGFENPEPPTGTPTAPKSLTGDAADEWGRMVARLEKSKTLSVVDDGVLYQYCRLFAETEAIAVAQEETAASIGILEENLRGLESEEMVAAIQEITKLRSLEARYTTQIRQGRVALRTYLVEFGLTPAARSRVKVLNAEGDGKKTSPLARIQSQAQGISRVK